ncbi:MAG: DNA internalization-related competence protein ComEC/Rec2 [Porticoccaceae bacterium]|nr:DNA internalization-related competence protein ComEC/Rec2 [Porticoccaceae bacterium]MDG1485076.1 DNA internalization-related competence protein ComEC/Rec2 [Porticoccaceae bacterium]
MTYLLALSIGIFSVAFFSELPDLRDYLIVLASINGFWIIFLWVKPFSVLRIKQTILMFLLYFWGVAWGIFQAVNIDDTQLKVALHGADFLVSGLVLEVIEDDERRTSFNFLVHNAFLVSDSKQKVELKKIRLNYYLSNSEDPSINIAAGSYWQFKVRLSRPRGLLNTNGFDYHSWLLQHGYSALGYVRRGADTQQLHNYKASVSEKLLVQINNVRLVIRTAIDESNMSPLGKGILMALAVGNKQSIDPWWDDLARLGIVHLLVISGLHIGLVGGLGFMLGALIVRPLIVIPANGLAYTVFRSLSLWLPITISILFAVIYSLLAGFTLPTQRALVALLVLMVGKLMFRQINPWAIFCWAILCIAISQPLAILSSGFWLSFSAVAALIGWFYPRYSAPKSNFLKRLLFAQIALICLMCVPLFIFMGQISWLGPIVNLFAVPWVSMTTVPLTLLGVFFYYSFPELSAMMWLMADWTTFPIGWLLQVVPNNLGFVRIPLPLDWPILASILIACLSVFLPGSFFYKFIAVLPLALISLFPAVKTDIRLTILDVGQGLAVIFEANERLLVYDVGPKHSDHFDTGTSVVLPFMRHMGYSKADRVIISHEDNDHSGGFLPLASQISIGQVSMGPGYLRHLQRRGVSLPNIKKFTACHAGQHWQWEGRQTGVSTNTATVKFDVLWPPFAGPKEGNNSSCVVQIRWQDKTILLTGDIGINVERSLLDDDKLRPAGVTVLVAPHHGSKSSSSRDFVQRIMPKHVVFSSGFRHHYGHPHPVIVKRYQKINSHLWRTSSQGAVSFVWSADGELKAFGVRDQMFPRCFTCQAWWR